MSRTVLSSGGCLIPSKPSKKARKWGYGPDDVLPPEHYPWPGVWDLPCVYFIGPRAGAEGLIKIGRAGNVVRRLAEMQSTCPTPLKVLTVVQTGDPAWIEKQLHLKLSSSRAYGEWFHPTAEVLAVLDAAAERYDQDADLFGDSWSDSLMEFWGLPPKRARPIKIDWRVGRQR